MEFIAAMFKLVGSDGKGIGTNCEKYAFTPADMPLLKTAGELKESGVDCLAEDVR